ncbi:phycobilisome rod-core linker polypeptide [Limnofasciculus baicalensis]|uniref:Phycobilisome linker polypeptide n=1 Tax=Limnofasciculus baicalensis BBK-W-15 TaxID=2699891 RepID=A0AAE3GUJ3_9CYAN|nr:phycobilisome rod-core linker polypeptide [Limnofasciculus baicalensis]MCP2730955.1 phycobilisome linker polypeptide [Limnofasciculus baicalensis BBK-W-15]
MALWSVDSAPVEQRQNGTEDDLQTVISAVYKQVLGNGHLMESERLTSAESQLRNGNISVRQFVNVVAKSDLYKSLFFQSSSQYRFIELNCKHLLGRAPLDQAEIAVHVATYNEAGYDAEIDSYIDSDEYIQSFGENVVPYARTVNSQVGIKNVNFNRTFSLVRGAATSDKSNKAKLISAVAGNLPTAIKAPVSGGGNPSQTSKRYRIAASASNCGPTTRTSNMEYLVDYSQLSQRVQNIQKSGGKILSITVA